jgi:hypothetical protein
MRGAVHVECMYRFKVLTAVSMKMAVFWFVAPCSLVEVCHNVSEVLAASTHRPEYGGSKDL